MPASRYKVWAVGAPVGLGATASVHIGVAAIGKKATAQLPYIVANELVCNMIAQFLLLPCPPGGLLDHNGETFFASLNFNMAGQALPPVNTAAVVAALPTLCWGVTLFDILVMNGDRHQGNVAFNTLTSELQIFDHSHAFMAPSGDIDARLAQCATVLAIGGHCLVRELNTWHGFDDWISRISQLPDFCIEGAVQAGCEVGLPQARQAAIADFLKARRDGLSQLVANNVASFPRLPARPPAAPAFPPAAPGVGAAPIAPAP